MKFAKVLIALAILAPQVASAQDDQNPLPPGPVPTNFVFLAPVVASLLALPLLGGDTTPSTNGTN